MTRDPRTSDLIGYICQVQPELDEIAARRILDLDPAIRDGIAQNWRELRDRAESLLELHLVLEGTPA